MVTKISSRDGRILFENDDHSRNDQRLAKSADSETVDSTAVSSEAAEVRSEILMHHLGGESSRYLVFSKRSRFALTNRQ